MSNKTLACLGGEPAFAEKLHVGRPNVGNEERFFELARQVFARRWFSNNGECVKEFEDQLSKFLGVKHCIAMCNATVALEITTRALGLKGEVIVPSFTFIATAHSLQWQEITPVFCDVDRLTHNIDPRSIERLITPRTTGIVGVHIWGRPCDINALQEIADKHHLQLMFDASHAFACSYQGRMIGGFGRAEIFSFHATKFMNTFEGGAVATNDDALAEKIRLMKNFGFSGYDNVIYIGTNGKMNELSAAMGLSGMESLALFIDTNRSHHELYRHLLRDIPGLQVMQYDAREKNNYQYVILEVESSEFGMTRDELVRALHAENVLARRYFHPGCHRMEPYRSYYPNAGLLLPETERLTERILALPTGTGIEAGQIATICSLVRDIQSNAGAIAET